MENQEFMVVEESESNELVIDNYSRTNLATSATWAKILAIIGFIGIGYMLLSGLIGLGFSFIFEDNNGRFEGMNNLKFISGLIPFTNLLIAAIMLYPILKLFNFSKFTKLALRNNNQKELILAFESQSKYFKFMGILSLITISILVIGAIGISIYDIMQYR